MYKPHRSCRACGYARSGSSGVGKSGTTGQLVPVFDLGLQPLANDFCDPRQERAGFAPLKVLYCPVCTLAQLSVVVNPEVLYSNYAYVTSDSQTMRDHFANLYQLISEEQPLNHVVEVGSNDGKFLHFLKAKGAVGVLGIDPAENLTDEARKNDIPSLTALFDRKSANEAAVRFPGELDVIIARHVFCHTDNWTDFMDSALVPSTKETLLVIEVPYVKDLLQNCEFDTIYHEHLSYFTVGAMKRLCDNSGWRLHRIVRLGIHGGSILVMLRRTDSEERPDASVLQFLTDEQCDKRQWDMFNAAAKLKIDTLKGIVKDWRSRGKRVAGYGASAKSTVWINACGFDRSEIEFVTDTTPNKQWKLVPGTSIPIVDPAAIVRDPPDLMILFAWNYHLEILQKEAKFAAKGGKWLIPSPEVTIV